MTTPDLGLLLDVDGPIASPVTRTLRIPSIGADLVTLVGAGVPIAFITGRSEAFIRDHVVGPLREMGLDEALSRPGTRMFGVFEKGGAWASITADGLGELTVDETVALPAADVSAVRDLVASRFTDTMFFDDTKRAMISVEQNVDATPADYRAAQSAFQDAAYDLLSARGLGLAYRERRHADAGGAVPFRIDPTVISTDIESVLLDKDRGTRRALEHFAASGPLPTRWRSVGDSRPDYTMADELHAQGFEVAHVDVRPSDGVLERPYRIVIEGDLIHDDAGAAFLRHWVRELGL
ncbi:hypothetical protein [Microbacterium gorillae]|uniref:hypothetical protein n=1 Tax=Microbacterium gorillae TaxID=1231063 RepID=UPI00058BE32F|nr:hypothetical protein [Microbacterium gorillae]